MLISPSWRDVYILYVSPSQLFAIKSFEELSTFLSWIVFQAPAIVDQIFFFPLMVSSGPYLHYSLNLLLA